MALYLIDYALQIMAQNRGPTILIAMWTTTSITTVFVAARLYTRMRILKSTGIDNYLITV